MERVVKHFHIEIGDVPFHVDVVSRQEREDDVTDPEQRYEHHYKLGHLPKKNQPKGPIITLHRQLTCVYSFIESSQTKGTMINVYQLLLCFIPFENIHNIKGPIITLHRQLCCVFSSIESSQTQRTKINGYRICVVLFVLRIFTKPNKDQWSTCTNCCVFIPSETLHKTKGPMINVSRLLC